MTIKPLSNFYKISESELILQANDAYQLKACLYRPVGIENTPAVVCVHGGAWVSGDRYAVSGLTDIIAQTGITVLAIDTRLAPRFRYPHAVIDVVFAIRWLKHHADEYGIDAGRVGILGVSSGGFLGVMATLNYDSPEFFQEIDAVYQNTQNGPAFIASCSGVLDPFARYEMARSQQNTEIMMCHDAFFNSIHEMEEASPFNVLSVYQGKNLPPAIFFQGELDPRLPIDTAEKTAGYWNRAGGKAKAIVYPGAEHSVGTWSRKALIDMLTNFHALATEPSQPGLFLVA